MKWGEACGFGRSTGYDKRLDEPILQPRIESTLKCIEMMFHDGKNLKSRYGLRPFGEGLDIVRENEDGSRRLSFSALKARMPRRQKISAMRDTVKWAVADKKKFGELVQYLYEFIGDLERLTQHLGIVERQQVLVQDQIESISDIPTLENMEASRIEPADRISDAASERLQRLSGSTQSRRRLSGQSRDEVESSRQTYTTAPEELPPSESVMSQTVESRETPEYFLYSTSQSERIMADLRRRIPEYSNVKPIDASSVGALIADLRRCDLRTIFKREDLITPNQRFNRLITSTSVPRNLPHPSMISAAPDAACKQRMLRELYDSNVTRIQADYVHVQPVGDSIRLFLGSMEGPPSSPHHGGIFHVLFLIPRAYPFKPPYCKFITKIYHPNIDLRGGICLDLLNQQGGPWCLSMTLITVIISIVSLLDDPGIEAPLVPEIAQLFLQDKQQYQDNARSYTQKYTRELVPSREIIEKCFLEMTQLTRDDTPIAIGRSLDIWCGNGI